MTARVERDAPEPPDAADRPAMQRWRRRPFGYMTRNALAASAFFRLRPNRVVELGAQVEPVVRRCPPGGRASVATG